MHFIGTTKDLCICLILSRARGTGILLPLRGIRMTFHHCIEAFSAFP